MKKIFIKTFGCQMNVRDAEAIKGLLLDAGFKVKDQLLDNMDAVLLVTCSVRQHAEDKVWSEIGRLASFKPKPLVVLVGCMAENYKEVAFKKARGLDLVIGPNNIDEIPGLLRRLFDRKQATGSWWPTKGKQLPVVLAGKPHRDEAVYESRFREEKDHAYVIISEGCDNYCSYCVVPYVRGMLRNRNHEDILDEIRYNIDKGIKRITLLGQNVNAYCSQEENFDFVELLERINGLKGLKELTFVTSHPKDASVKLFEAMARLEKINKSLHLPVQSGSNRILKLMNRGYTRQHYLYLAERYRKLMPSASLSTDIIAGFPTETDKDFRETLDLVKRVKFNNAYIFKYSFRPHTAAEKLKDDVAQDVKEKRHQILLDTQKRISKELKNA